MTIDFEKFEISFYVVESRFIGITFEEDCGDGYAPICSTTVEAIFLSYDSALALMNSFTLEDFYDGRDEQFDIAEVRLVRYVADGYREAEGIEELARKDLLPQKEES